MTLYQRGINRKAFIYLIIKGGVFYLRHLVNADDYQFVIKSDDLSFLKLSILGNKNERQSELNFIVHFPQNSHVHFP